MEEHEESSTTSTCGVAGGSVISWILVGGDLGDLGDAGGEVSLGKKPAEKGSSWCGLMSPLCGMGKLVGCLSSAEKGDGISRPAVARAAA